MNYDNPLEIVDVSEINEDAAKKILHAAHTQGFLMLEGHGFTQEEVDQVYKLSESYFTSETLEEKMKYPLEDATNKGYTAMGAENLEESDPNKPVGDPKEGFNFAGLDLATGIPQQDLPEIFQDNLPLISSTVLKMYHVMQNALKLLAIGLEIDPAQGGADWFAIRHPDDKESGSTFRFLRYPSPVKPGASEEEKDKYRNINIAGAHTDYGGLTLLFQKKDEDGLQILSPMSKKWESVPYVPASPKFAAKGEAPPLVVNIADQLSFWTNGYLKSTVHRVRFPAKLLDTAQDRYSVVFFAHPADQTLLEPVPSKIIESIQGRGASEYLAKNGESQTAGAHLARRLANTYGWGKY